MFGYRVPRPDEAMLISGGKAKGAPFQVIIGHGKFNGPTRKVRFLTLAMQESEVSEPCTTKQGIPLVVKAVIAFKVGNDTESIINAGQRFLSDQSQMPTLTGRIFAGHLRSIVGNMTVEEIITERQRLAEEVLDASKTEMAKMGLIVDALQIQSIDDENSGYIKAMAAPHTAAIQRDASIAQAQANQAAAEAEQLSQQKQVGYKRETTIAQANADAEISAATQEAERKKVDANRQTAIAQAQAKAEVDKAQATASQAGPLTQAQSQKAVLEAQTALAEQNALLKERQLQADVVKPAQAEAEKTIALAEAEAKRTQLQAEAMAAANNVTLEQKMIDQLPELVKAAASGLQGANVNVLNGAEGLTELVNGFVSQAATIMDTWHKVRADSGVWTLGNTTSDGKALPSQKVSK